MTNSQNIALLIEYLGTSFFGFQRQKACRTIQGELEAKLSKFAHHPIEIITAGRTDAGVHALNQIVNFTTTSKRELFSWVRGINGLLDPDISIKQAAFVPYEFNSRFTALSRTYCYYLYVNPIRPAILNARVGWYYAPLDIEKMKEASQALLGTHDFSSFRASDCQANTPTRHMLESEIIVQNDIIRFKFTANAFLYHMVRNIVGALIYVGNGKLSADGFCDMFKDLDRKKAPPTFMPDGLYLADVKFKTPIFDYPKLDWLGLEI
jgi:tRNA pseudouridine38-40 synthase